MPLELSPSELRHAQVNEWQRLQVRKPTEEFLRESMEDRRLDEIRIEPGMTYDTDILEIDGEKRERLLLFVKETEDALLQEISAVFKGEDDSADRLADTVAKSIEDHGITPGLLSAAKDLLGRSMMNRLAERFVALLEKAPFTSEEKMDLLKGRLLHLRVDLHLPEYMRSAKARAKVLGTTMRQLLDKDSANVRTAIAELHI